MIHHSLYDSRTNRAPVLEGTLISSDGADFLGFFGGSTGWDGFVDNRYRFSLAAQGGEFLIGFIDYYSSSYGYHGAIQAETGSGFFSDFEIEPWARVGDVATSPSGSSWTAFYRSGSTVYRRTLSSGSSIGSERSVGTGSSSLRDIRAAGDLVTWWDPSSREVAVVRWSGGAAPKRTFATESSWTYNPEIAEGDSTYLYVWEDDPTGGTDRVFAQLIGTDGIASGDTIALGPAQDPDVTWTGSEFLVVMRVGEDIGAVRISGDGVLLDGTPAILTEDIDTVCLRPSVDSDGRRRALVAYDRFVDISGSFQVRTRIVDLAVAGTDPMGAPCENGWTCASGFCADGVCCSAPCTGACETCSASSGATADGACTPVSAGTPCRAADGECDVAESCDGSAGTCPADGVAAAGTACGAGPTGP
ncbi:MAG: hypothetical protein GWO04_37365, partial [Actinobacteria bacterium]|nr:hypothetical protein [Actinomycetota bacterium]NIW31854.1 hypothetical protein [Actinomycetota bacterium]